MLACAIGLGACLDLAAPTDDIESLSALVAAYPAVIAGDTLRDSLGVARRLDVAAYTGRGDSVATPDGLRFFIADTGTGARIEDGYLIAGAKLGPVRVVAQVPGLQTPPVTIRVVPMPSLVRAEPATDADTVTLPARQYVLQPSITSDPLTVRVLGDVAGVPTDVDGWIVRYAITRQPDGSEPGAPPAYLADDQGRALRGDSLAAIDTTSGGTAARKVIFRQFFVPARSAGQVDTVIVEARVRRHGVPLPGSPVVFRVLFEPAPTP